MSVIFLRIQHLRCIDGKMNSQTRSNVTMYRKIIIIVCKEYCAK